jgi:hypothetical protein
MKTSYNLGWAALAVVLPLALSSCSKEQLTQSDTPVVVNQADVKVANGRVVFANLQAFTKVEASLGKMSFEELDQWEQNLKFTSLRKVADTQSRHLEQLQNTGEPTAAFDLMQSFGIPTFYATAISPSGEYQIGDKIFWFHEGYKYEATSEQELAQIKQDPSAAKEKSWAGIQVVSKKALPVKGGAPIFTTNAVQSSLLECDDKYVSNTFNYDSDGGSQRRAIFGTHIFTEYINTTSGVGTWHSIFYLRSKVDYYSSGRNAWYSADGSNRTTYYDVHFTGSAARKGYESYATNVTADQTNPFFTFNGDHNLDFSLADVQVQAPRVYDGSTTLYSSDPVYVYWNFQMTGSIRTVVGSANRSDNYTYSVGGSGVPLWQ